jgi:ribonuclease PH
MQADDATAPPADAAKGRPAKVRRRPSPKADTDGAEKRSLNLRIDTESYRRLSVHALMGNTTISAMVEGFAKSLKGYSMPHRLGGSTGPDES